MIESNVIKDDLGGSNMIQHESNSFSPAFQRAEVAPYLFATCNSLRVTEPSEQEVTTIRQS
jgi:hypothetical protein